MKHCILITSAGSLLQDNAISVLFREKTNQKCAGNSVAKRKMHVNKSKKFCRLQYDQEQTICKTHEFLWSFSS